MKGSAARRTVEPPLDGVTADKAGYGPGRRFLERLRYFTFVTSTSS